MKHEYVKKFNTAKRLLEVYEDNLSEEENESNFWKGHALMEELVETKDTEVLCLLLELFNKTNENGVCETLMNDIWNNYTAEQIIEAISQKFDYLVENDLWRFACLCNILFKEDDFVKFRKMFNEIQSTRSAELLNELDKWIDDDYEVGPEGIALLREDMSKW